MNCVRQIQELNTSYALTFSVMMHNVGMLFTVLTEEPNKMQILIQ